MHNIDITLRIGIANGPEIKESVSTNVDAYDEIIFKIEPQKTKKVEVQPGTKDKLLFLLIKSTLYSDKDNQILYIAEEAEPTINLDKTHFYQGAGGISSLGDNPNIFTFQNKFPNTSDENQEKNTAEIQILVGRKAVSDVS